MGRDSYGADVEDRVRADRYGAPEGAHVAGSVLLLGVGKLLVGSLGGSRRTLCDSRARRIHARLDHLAALLRVCHESIHQSSTAQETDDDLHVSVLL